MLSCYLEAITGILQQTYQNWELIVVDDGSRDDFDASIACFVKDPRIRVFTQKNQRLPAALNNGFHYARGDYWTWTSADNIMLPQQLETLVATLHADPGVGLVFSDYEAIDDRGLPLQDPHWRAHNRPDGGSVIRLPCETTIESLPCLRGQFPGSELSLPSRSRYCRRRLRARCPWWRGLRFLATHAPRDWLSPC